MTAYVPIPEKTYFLDITSTTTAADIATWLASHHVTTSEIWLKDSDPDLFWIFIGSDHINSQVGVGGTLALTVREYTPTSVDFVGISNSNGTTGYLPYDDVYVTP